MERYTLSRGAKKLIKEAISNLPLDKKCNSYYICDEVVNLMIKKYIGDPDEDGFENKSENLLMYQAKRMGMETTLQVMEKIETYMYKLLKQQTKNY